MTWISRIDTPMTSKKSWLFLLLALLLISIWLVVTYEKPHNPRVFGPPEKTGWAPSGPRIAASSQSEVIPEPTKFNAIHVDVANSDNLWIAAAPMFELDWVAETDYFIGNGPLFDKAGNLYFSPQFYHGERVVLVSLDAQTGERRWVIPASEQLKASSPVFILNDPENPGKEILYLIGFDRLMAITTDGSVIWSRPTGVTPATDDFGERQYERFLSFNYHAASDSLIALTQAGAMVAYDRRTGEPVSDVTQIPGSPAISSKGTKVPSFVLDRVDPLMDEAFGKTERGQSIFSAATNYVFGGGKTVTNFFSIDPVSSRIFVAATAPDEEDGAADGRSALGAIYTLELVDTGNDSLEFQIIDRMTFPGGTGSTPALSADGQRVYVSDNDGNVIALDSRLNVVWRFNVGEPLVGSITVAPDNHELYAVTSNDVIQLIDEGSEGRLGWTAELNGFDGYANVDTQSNALTATLTANGVVVMIGGGKSVLGKTLMLHVGMGLLDRGTGKLRYFAEGREDSLAMSVVGPDGSLYVGHSPLRRAVGKAFYPNLTDDLTGGVARFKPIRRDLLVRDAVCAAEARADNAITLDPQIHANAIGADLRQIHVLVEQALSTLPISVDEGDLSEEISDRIRRMLKSSDNSLRSGDLYTAIQELSAACSSFR